MSSVFEHYQKVYQFLEDDLSKSIYLARLNYLISNNFDFIKRIIPEKLKHSPLPTYTNSVIPEDAKIVLYGTGSCPKNTYREWCEDKRIIGFCSQNKEKQRTGYLGYSVLAPEELLKQNEYFVVISVAKQDLTDEILGTLRAANYPMEKVFLYTDYQEDADQYFPVDIVEFSKEEVFIDAGCFRLDTVTRLKERCPDLKRVYAFEPDPENYKVCINKKSQTNSSEVELFPYGAWSHRDVLHFSNVGTSNGAIVNTDSSVSVEVVSIDEIVCFDDSPKVTFIKMDIEGSELEALKGAKKTIQRDKPKLAICIYHKPEDMTEIPLYIKELVPEYKLYIRHHSSSAGETVLYAIP